MLGFLDKVLEYYYGNRTVYQTYIINYITIMFFATWDAKIALSKPCLTLQFLSAWKLTPCAVFGKMACGNGDKSPKLTLI